ncbi:MAG: uroporphyrinogen decarboxylase family protein [Candidatus Omnitrophica bacterium]|nr:uroporphyrinogen decarboxylase family protein [Candidatus Omnitrophota bacterium]
MTPKERIYGALEGRPVDLMPVAVLYSHLYFQDHFTELTGKPRLELLRWLYSEPEEYLNLYKHLISNVPFDILEPHSSPPYKVRKNIEFVEEEGKIYLHNKKEGTFEPVKIAEGHTFESVANEQQKVFDKEDVRKIKISNAEELMENYDYARVIIKEMGTTHFVITTGLTGILWNCHNYLGYTNTLMMLAERSTLLDYLGRKLLEQKLEQIRSACLCGGDAIFIDDALAYSDVISRRHYEEFVLPYIVCLPTTGDIERG